MIFQLDIETERLRRRNKHKGNDTQTKKEIEKQMNSKMIFQLDIETERLRSNKGRTNREEMTHRHRKRHKQK